MSGAYVAKPEVVTPPVNPPKWNPNWVFPGPTPPGYEPGDGMFLAADSEISPGVATTGVSAVTMDVRAGAVQPTGSITFTATIDGVPIGLKIA